VRFWYRTSLLGYLLAPLGFVFVLVGKCRRLCYRLGLKQVYRAPVPVIVVGNIHFGGTGKTPLVIALANYLKRQGLKPAIVSRGYSGKSKQYPCVVTQKSDPLVVGDEPCLMARRTDCPIVIDPVRPNAIQHVIEHFQANVIISDDGLQHYAMARDIEIAVIDGQRWFGNGFCLPAGPLREPVSRLKQVDFTVVNGGSTRYHGQSYLMQLRAEQLRRVDGTDTIAEVGGFRDTTVHAVAGIGHPERFFLTLESMGIRVQRHPFPDHHHFIPSDILFNDTAPVIMTEKDAVKCWNFANDNCWYLPVTAELEVDFLDMVSAMLGVSH
tara:strand:- start:36453 stop:37427 length:975 start_codon:yes stop_codon:yes gene_type:complete